IMDRLRGDAAVAHGEAVGALAGAGAVGGGGAPAEQGELVLDPQQIVAEAGFGEQVGEDRRGRAYAVPAAIAAVLAEHDDVLGIIGGEIALQVAARPAGEMVRHDLFGAAGRHAGGTAVGRRGSPGAVPCGDASASPASGA